MAWLSFQYLPSLRQNLYNTLKKKSVCHRTLMYQSNAFNVACNTQALVDNCASINKMNCKHTGFHNVLSLCYFFNIWLWKHGIKSRPRCPPLCVTNSCRLPHEGRLSLKHMKVRNLLSERDIIKIGIKVASPDVYSCEMLKNSTKLDLVSTAYCHFDQEFINPTFLTFLEFK